MKRPQPTSPKNNANEDKHQLILRHVLAQVPFDGWTDAALKRGIRAAEVPSHEVEILFPQGLKDLIHLFGTTADEAVNERIKKESGFAKMRVREKIAFSVRARLEFLMPHREAMRRLMIWYTLPFHWSLGMKRLYQTVDLTWRAAGDSSTDFNFYTKRGLLAAVFKATILFWLDDETPTCKASWEFLDRRIENVMGIGQMLSKLRT